jgi:hypothetical protein
MINDQFLTIACIIVWAMNIAVLTLIVSGIALDMYRRRKRGY